MGFIVHVFVLFLFYIHFWNCFLLHVGYTFICGQTVGTAIHIWPNTANLPRSIQYSPTVMLHTRCHVVKNSMILTLNDVRTCIPMFSACRYRIWSSSSSLALQTPTYSCFVAINSAPVLPIWSLCTYRQRAVQETMINGWSGTINSIRQTHVFN